MQAGAARIYTAAGRFEEAFRRTQRAVTLDPKNPDTHGALIIVALLARQPAEALRAANLAAAEFAGLRSWPTYIIWDHTGTGPPTALWVGSNPREITASSSLRSATAVLYPLRLEHRYQAMADYLASANVTTIRGEPGYNAPIGVHPVAELRGWAHLLLGDRAAAARDAQGVLDFVAHTEETQWNRAWLSLLTAESSAFSGDKTGAVAAAGKALELSQSPRERGRVSPLATAVYAWSGAGDDAASLLEELSTQIPMVLQLGPATIARDPLYTVPLSANARYQALRAKLEAQMAATKLE
jgi:hypothetical protein